VSREALAAPRNEKFTGGLRHCRGINQIIDLILGITAAVVTALLMGLIARNNIRMPPDVVREADRGQRHDRGRRASGRDVSTCCGFAQVRHKP
jgi:hypothetical protein